MENNFEENYDISYAERLSEVFERDSRRYSRGLTEEQEAEAK